MNAIETYIIHVLRLKDEPVRIFNARQSNSDSDNQFRLSSAHIAI